eukprot:Awhi_evm1s12327
MFANLRALMIAKPEIQPLVFATGATIVGSCIFGMRYMLYDSTVVLTRKNSYPWRNVAADANTKVDG